MLLHGVAGNEGDLAELRSMIESSLSNKCNIASLIESVVLVEQQPTTLVDDFISNSCLIADASDPLLSAEAALPELWAEFG